MGRSRGAWVLEHSWCLLSAVCVWSVIWRCYWWYLVMQQFNSCVSLCSSEIAAAVVVVFSAVVAIAAIAFLLLASICEPGDSDVARETWRICCKSRGLLRRSIRYQRRRFVGNAPVQGPQVSNPECFFRRRVLRCCVDGGLKVRQGPGGCAEGV
ncbi:uncharacterized protein BDZ83DRAFT_641526 [Colletotrichum acutatum]|uniref:Uncharacterized protein n=1 Tax=Glomerella acutata TaxID=27357 RepID=A0AAD8XBH3_GLOAC|nr:uncharacterized protein BDZ83DRAFT_641526 [Colletotrichum acutatum]KAK1709169.1 hypothetical protein BDZ83DRAFT_641526 [Colletotrichum acutatum]